MSFEQLTLNLSEIQQKVSTSQFLDALRIIRDSKILDLNNIYLSALEQYVSKLSAAAGEADTTVLNTLITRANEDARKRGWKEQADQPDSPYARTLAFEKLKNVYFQRSDEYMQKGEYGRALEEVRRVYIFEPMNIVAKEYELKLTQLVSMQTKE